jgi:DNA-directed RNA polymerase specialized sigma subunit
MTAKEYLQQYRESIARADEVSAHLNELKAEAIRLKDHEGQSVALDDAVAQYVDACNDAAAYLDTLGVTRKEITDTIEAVQNEKLKLLLQKVYINGESLVRVAADREQSYEHICRLHGDALNAVRALRPDLE